MMANHWLKALNECLERFNRSRDLAAYETGRARVLDVLADEAGVTDAEAEARLVYLSRSGDGYLREAAVRQLGRQGRSEDAFRVLIERCNDWVPQVRQAALKSAGMFLDAERRPVVLNALDAVVHLTRKSRGDHAGLVDQVAVFLDQPEHRATVLMHFRKSRGPVAVFLLSRLLRWPEALQAEIARLCTRHKDFLVRSRFLSACEASGMASEAALRAMFADRHPRNRQKAFLALWKLLLADRQTLLERALLDPSGAVRGVALWAAEREAFDLAAFVAAQRNGETLAPREFSGWLHLLGVLKNPESLPVVVKAFTDIRPGVRHAALSAWVKLSRETADEPTVQAMLDPSPKVAKLASQLLRKGKVLLSGEQLLQIGEALEKRGDLGRLLAFSQHLGYWERLAWMLELLQRYREEHERQMIVRAVAESLAKQRYAFSGQPPATQERLRQAMRISGLRDIWRNHDRLRVSLAQFD